MSPSEIFNAVVILPPEQRAAYLDQTCGDNRQLRDDIESLLQAHEAPDSFLREPGGRTATYEPAAELAGSLIGPYKLIEPIGEGGMGTVWMAQQQEPVKRVVALKLIKAGMDSKQVLARFEAERQALALMDHPNIAKIFDGGIRQAHGQPSVALGRPYFVMELVKGQPITKYCDEHHLTPRQRLELFIPVCHAIQHAHQKGIIHRDLKPSNVLVAQYDGRPVPKVIDFGVAKAAGQSLTDKTLVTGFGNIVGTLEYMSPEQAEINQLDIDTRSDIYSLGVLLYELLAGSTPFSKKDLEKAGMLEMLRVIREDEPSKPSTKLSSSDALPSLSASRGTEPAKLTKLVRGELDWIVMKALEKDRNRRYETANGFAMDVQRYLADEQVMACPPSATYRLRKFARRNKRSLASLALVSLAVLAVAVALGWAARDRAAREVAIQAEVSTALNEAERWQQQESWSEALSAVKRADGLLAGAGSDDLRNRVQLLRKDVEMVLRLEEIRLLSGEVVEGSLDWNGMDRAYEQAFRDYGIDVGGLSVDEAAARIHQRDNIAKVLAISLDNWARAWGEKDPAGRTKLTALARAIDPDPWRCTVREATERNDVKALEALAAAPELSRQPATNLTVLANALRKAGLTDARLVVLRRAQRQHPGDFWINYYLAFDLRAPNPAHIDEAVAFARAALAARPQNPAALNLLGFALHSKGNLDEAVASFERAITLDAKFIYSHYNLGNVLRVQMKLDEAVASHKRAIAIDPKFSGAHSGLGLALTDQGKLDEAIASHERAIEFAPETGMFHFNFGVTLMVQGKRDEAVASYERAIALHPKLAIAHYNLGNTLTEQKKRDEAVASYKRAIAIDPRYLAAHNNLGKALTEQKKLDEAVASYKRAIAIDPNYFTAHFNLGVVLQLQENLAEAIVYIRNAIEIDPKSAMAEAALGSALSEQGNLDGAVASYERAIAIDPKWAPAHLNLGIAQKHQGKLEEAVASYKRAIALDPKFSLAYYNLGIALTAQRKLDEAIASYERAIALDPKDATAHYKLGQVKSAQGKWAAAVASYERAIEHNPGYIKARIELGINLRLQNKWEESAAAFRRAIDLDSKNALAHFKLGEILGHLGQVGEAIASYQRAIDLEPKDTERLIKLAGYLVMCPEVKHRDPARAVALAKRAVELKPDASGYQATLGGAHYRAGNWKDAVAALTKSLELSKGRYGGSFCLAMAHWKLGNKVEARMYYDQAVDWMGKSKFKPLEITLAEQRAEAAELLGIQVKEK